MREINFLTWNLKNSGLKFTSAIKELYDENKPDFLLLVESDLPDKQVENLCSNTLKSVMLTDDKSIRLYVNPGLNVNMVNEQTAEDGRYRQIKDRMVFFNCQIDSIQFVLVGVHFPSKYKNPPNTQYNIMKRWLEWIRAQEIICKTENSIIFGDLNLNPFDIALYRNGGLNAHPTTMHSTVVKPLYYNPMWSTMGNFIYKSNEEKVPGTFFYDFPIDNGDDFHWNAIDGVLIKKPIVNLFSRKDLEIIVRTKSHVFSNLHGIESQTYSDHLPLKFKLIL
jgi:hypothetical protein